MPIKFKELIKTINESVEFLEENRIEFLKKNTQELSTDHDTLATHKDKDAIIDHFAENGDPSKNKVHTQWLIKQYKAGNIRQEDAPGLKDTLSNFDKYKGKLEKKDIGQYKTPSELRDAVAPHLGTSSTKKEASEEGRTEIHSEPGLKVYHLHSREASEHHYGGGSAIGGNHTDWCTAARGNKNMFDSYSKSGKLYTFHKEGDPRSPYQLHIHNTSMHHDFMDRKDEKADINDMINEHPKLKDVKEFKESPHLAFHSDEDIKKNVEKEENKTTDKNESYLRKALENIKDRDFLDKRLGNEYVHTNPHLSKEQQEKIYNEYGAKSLKNNKNLHPDLIDKVGIDFHTHKNISKENLLNHIKSGSYSNYQSSYLMNITNHPKADSDVVDSLYDNSNNHSHRRLIITSEKLSHDKLEKHMEHPIDSGILAKRKDLTPDHYARLDKYARDNDFDHIAENLAKNKKVPSKVHDDIISRYGNDHEISKLALKSKGSK